MGVLQQSVALLTELAGSAVTGMMITTVDVEHGRDGALFAQDAAAIVGRAHPR